MFKFKPKHNTYLCWGITAFLTVFAILAAYDILLGAHRLLAYLGIIATVSMPVVMGAVIAYLLAPIVDFLERTVLHRWAAKGIINRKPRGWVRIVSILMAFVLVLGAITLMLCFLIPNTWSSILKLIENIPMYVDIISGWFHNFNGSTISVPDEVYAWFGSSYAHLMDSLSQFTSSSFSGMLSKVSGGVVGVFSFFSNLVLGLIIAAYMIGMKERLSAQGKKILCALFEMPYVERILEAFHYTDRVFGGFIRGKLLDSLIIGILCFIVCGLLQFPYTPIISIFVGVTNIIPFFGPFLGAIPCAFLILLVDPMQCLYFIIFILILQQFDGNILGPKILGQSTGLASLWVIISVLVGGALFGPLGMLLGCPAFALIYALMRIFINRGLEKKDLPTETDAYRSSGLPNKTEVLDETQAHEI